MALAGWIDTQVGLLTLLRGWSIPDSNAAEIVLSEKSEEVAEGAIDEADSAPPTEVSAVPRTLPRSDACHRALELYGRFPPGLRFTSLSGRVVDGGGEYTLEGLCEPEEVATLFGFIDTLKGLPSEVNLSYWREGGKTEDGTYRFTFHGTLGKATTAGPQVAAVSAEGTRLLSETGAIATRAGLDSLMTRGPIRLPSIDGLGRMRQKHWAVGSYAQIQAFARELQHMRGTQPVLAEIVIMPGHGKRAGAGSLQLYAALDVVIEGEDR